MTFENVAVDYSCNVYHHDISKGVTEVKTTLKLERETKGTQVYKDERDDAPIPSLYIKKGAFGKKDPPTSITLEIKEL